MMVVLSGIRNVRVLCVCVAVPCCVTACVYDMPAAECALMLMLFHGSASIRRFLFLMMPIRQDCARSVRESISDLNRM